VSSFIEIPPLRTEILRHAQQVLTDGRTADQKTQASQCLSLLTEATIRFGPSKNCVSPDPCCHSQVSRKIRLQL